MASEATIDSLKIEIDASASKASSGIDSFIQSLQQLSSVSSSSINSLNGIKSALSDMKKNMVSKTTGTNLQSLANAANSLSSSSVSNVAGLKEQLQDLSQVKISKTLGTNLSRLNSAAAGSGSSGVATLTSQISKATNTTSSFSTVIGQLKGALGNIASFATGFKVVGEAMWACIDASNQYIEDMNLANTVLGEYADSAHQLAENYQELFGIDSGEFLRNMGTFDSMAKGMGVASDNAALMSKNLAQLGYDLASYYNIDTTSAMEKVRAGLAGELEPLRAIGYDLSQARLQQEAYNLGMNQSVSEMTQAEKAMLRYQAIMSQVSWAHGDLAKTIQSPSNMLRVFQQNITIAARSIGNIFLPMLQAILPVAIAVAKVLATVGNMIADLTGGTQIAETEFGSGGLDGVGSAAEDAADGLDDAADAANGTGGAADDAAGKVKELKRQLMGFDEINKFSSSTSGSGSGGNGGSGGSGGGGGAGDGGSGSISLDNYDWIGEGLGDDLYNEIMSFLERLEKALKPLAEAFSTAFAAIKNQFRDLDMVGAVENAIAGVVNLISNAVRNIIEILSPLVVAFNFPETIALAFDLAAQMCITLSSAINGVGSMVKGFTDTALIKLVSWIGDKLRAAIKTCIDILASWGQWFRDNTTNLNELGQAAGVSAGLVFELAMAVGNIAFDAATVVIKGLNTVLQTLCTILVNSQVARAAASLLGAALAAWATKTAIANGIKTINTLLGNMQTKITNTAAAHPALTNAVNTAKEKYVEFNDKVTASAKYLTEWATSSDRSQVKALNYAQTIQGLRTEHNNLVSKLSEAKSALDEQKNKYNEAKAAANGFLTPVKSLHAATEKYKTKAQEANVAIAENKIKLNEAKQATTEYTASNSKLSTGFLKLKANELQASAATAGSVASKVAATAASTALSVAETAAAAAATALKAALGGIVLTGITLAIEGLLNLLSPLTDGIFGAIKGFLGLDDATGDVTATTEEANEVLSEEQQQIQDNLDSIEDYEKSHNNLADALAESRMSEEEFATYLQESGQTLDEVTAKADNYVDTMINGFEKISTESQISGDEMLSNLQSNTDTMNTWSQNLITLMKETGLDSSNALIQELSEGGPSRYAQALQDIVDGGSPKMEEFKAQAESYSQAWKDQLTSGIDSGSGEYYQSGSDAIGNVTKGAADAGQETVTTASSIDEQTVQQFGSHYNEALDAGRNLSGGFGDGVAATDMVALAVSKAKDVCSQTVQAFNGGDGYNQTLAAGRNMVGGYGDGIAQAVSDATSKAKQVMTEVVKAFNGGTGYNNAQNAGKQVGTGYVNGIKNVQSQATSAAKNIMNAVVQALKANVSGATSSGRSMLNGYVSGIKAVSSTAQSAARNISSSVANALKTSSSSASSAGRTMGQNFVNGINGYSSQARSAGSSLASNAVSGAGSKSAYSAGQNIGSGFSNGISSYNNSVYWRGYNLAGSAISGIKARARIGSPSKVTYQFGQWIDEGLANGMGAGVKGVITAAQNMTQSVLDVTSTAAEIGAEVGAAFGSGIADGIDAKSVAQVLAYANESTAAANATNWTSVSGSRTSHTATGAVVDDSSMASILTGAVVDGLMSVQLATSNEKSGSAGATEIVLKVDSQTLARAVVKGNESLARRGVLNFT